MAQSNDLHSGLTASNSAQELNQMVRLVMFTPIISVKSVGFTHALHLLMCMQLKIRWVMTKEEHAAKIIKLVSEYCLCQRVKKEVFAEDKDYIDALKAHHAVMQAAMKCKQSVDPATADALDHAIGDFAKMYTK